MIGTVAGVVLGVLLVLSGLLKMGDPSWPAAARAMGAPGWSARFVPSLEVAVGACLAAGALEPWFAWAALALLAVFTVAQARMLRLPPAQRPRCSCFGRWSSKRVGPSTILRNVAMAGLGVVALVA